MSNKFDEMRAAVSEAKDTFAAADSTAHKMAGMLAGRLRHVGGSELEQLKRELREFNMKTHRWKRRR